MNISDVRDFKASERRARLRRKNRVICAQFLDASSAEEHYVDESHNAEVYKARDMAIDACAGTLSVVKACRFLPNHRHI